MHCLSQLFNTRAYIHSVNVPNKTKEMEMNKGKSIQHRRKKKPEF